MQIKLGGNRLQRFLVLLGIGSSVAYAISLLVFVVTVVCAIAAAAAIGYAVQKGLSKAHAISKARSAAISNALDNIPMEFFVVSGGTTETNEDGELVLTFETEEELVDNLGNVRLWSIERTENLGGVWVDTGNTFAGDEEALMEYCRKLYDFELRLSPCTQAFYRGKLM